MKASDERREIVPLRRDPSPADWEDWERRLAEGEEPVAAARARNLSTSAFRRQDFYRHQAALRMGREARGEVVDDVVERDVVEVGKDGVLRFREGTSDAMKQFWARRYQPAYRQGDKVELAIGQADPLGIGELTLEQRLALRARLISENPELVEMVRGGPVAELEAGTPMDEAL